MKLKNLFGMAAMAALVLSGCSSDEVVENFSPENAIEFGTYVGRDAQGRASVFETADMATAGFGVYAFYTGQQTWEEYKAENNQLAANFMNNTKVTSADGGKTWTYSPLKYWPNNANDKVSFFAYAPYSKNETSDNVTANSNGTIGLIVQNDVTQHEDLTAVLDHQIDQTKGKLDQVVKFEFTHILSRIEFTLQAAADQVDAGGNINEGTTITLNKITIGGEKPVGFYEKGEYSIWGKEWTYVNGNQAFTLTSANFVPNSNVLTSTDNDRKELIEEDGDDYIMVIPQKIAQLPITVEYTVETVGENAAGDPDNSTITNVMTNYVDVDFVANTIYKFHIVLGMSTVELSAEVKNWDTKEIEVDLPENVQ